MAPLSWTKSLSFSSLDFLHICPALQKQQVVSRFSESSQKIETTQLADVAHDTAGGQSRPTRQYRSSESRHKIAIQKLWIANVCLPVDSLNNSSPNQKTKYFCFPFVVGLHLGMNQSELKKLPQAIEPAAILSPGYFRLTLLACHTIMLL